MSAKKDGRITHGMTKSREFTSWRSMKSRCYGKTDGAYDRYGGRGITVCDRWVNSFENFYLDMGDRPEGKTIDRLDNDKGYYPDNCRWATHTEQQNNRRFNIKVIYNGIKKNLSEWCKELGLSYCMTSRRIEIGWTPEKAFNTGKDKTRASIFIEYKGNMATIAEISRITGINIDTIRHRYKLGLSSSEIIKKVEYSYNRLEYNGTIKSLTEWCEELGLKRSIIRKRLNRGWSVIDSLNTDILTHGKKKPT